MQSECIFLLFRIELLKCSTNHGFCLFQGYLYAYVFAVFCDCSDIFPLRPSEELPCDIPCPGDNETLCGSEANYEYDYFDYHYYYHYRDDSFIDSVLFTGNPGMACPVIGWWSFG